MRYYKVRFLPQDKEVLVSAGTGIAEAAGSAGLTIDAPCGQHGTCGKCLVICHGSLGSPTKSEKEKISAKKLDQGWRLACQTQVAEDMVVEIPGEAAGQLIKGNLTSKRAFVVEAAIEKKYLKIAQPSLSDQRADWERLKEFSALSQGEVELDLLRKLPDLLRENNFELTLVSYKGRLLTIESGDTTNCAYGCAIDIGTTTVVCSLHNLFTGEEISVTSSFNPQRVYGADVLSRIDFSLKDNNLEKLQELIVKQINRLIEETINKAGVNKENIYLISVVGNTTMQHLFLGLSPRYIAVPPFVGVLYTGLSFDARDLGIEINRHGKVTLLPHVAGYVGADIVAGVLATDAYKDNKPSLLIDVGTNAEIVLATNGSLYACSAAAGPAFEGANIKCGMKAGAGAIDKVWIKGGSLHYHVIGECEPLGLCGSGLIDVIAALLRVGIIDNTGRLLNQEESLELVSEYFANRLRETENGMEFIIAENNEQLVVLSQGDIRQVQLAKAAILAGINILSKEMGLKIEDIDQINLAGSFGNVLNRENAQIVGLIPPGVSIDKVKYAGNSAHIGAQLNLLRSDTGDLVDSVVQKMKYIELSDRMDFTEEFTEAIFFEFENKEEEEKVETLGSGEGDEDAEDLLSVRTLRWMPGL